MWHKVKVYQACTNTINTTQNYEKSQSGKTNTELKYMSELSDSYIKTVVITVLHRFKKLSRDIEYVKIPSWTSGDETYDVFVTWKVHWVELDIGRLDIAKEHISEVEARKSIQNETQMKIKTSENLKGYWWTVG